MFLRVHSVTLGNGYARSAVCILILLLWCGVRCSVLKYMRSYSAGKRALKMKFKKQHMGILLIIASAFCFSMMGLFVRLAGDLPSVEKGFFRNVVAAVFAFIIIVREKKGFAFDIKNLPLLSLRSICGTVGIVCNFYAIDKLVLADANMLNKMSPFFTLLFSALLLKEKLKPYQVAAVAAAFIGSLFILKPSFANAAFLPALIGFIGGLGAGLAYTCVRALGIRGERSSVIIFFFSAFSCVACLLLMIPVYEPIALHQLIMLILAGLSAAGGQFAITSAYFYAPAREISVYDYTAIIFSTIWGFAFFDQIPDLLSWIGYLVICGAAVFNFLKNAEVHKRNGIS